MIGAIAGDIIGSRWEFNRIKTTEFPLFSDKNGFTDDSIMTAAVADAILHDKDPAKSMREWSRNIRPGKGVGGYGKKFFSWLAAPEVQPPYNSFGNGAAMRISPVGFWYDTLEEVLTKAEFYTAVSHNHPEGIKGAQATASAIFLARTGSSKEEIRQYVTDTFGYDLNRTCDQIRPGYSFNETCQETVPEAIICFLESTDFENAVRLAVSLGGDSDTLACITGSIAEAFYGVPNSISWDVRKSLEWDGMVMYRLAEKFQAFCKFKKTTMTLHGILNMNAFVEDDQFDFPRTIFCKDYVIDENAMDNISIGLRLVFEDLSREMRVKFREIIIQAILDFNEIDVLPALPDDTRIDDEELNDFLASVENRLLSASDPAFACRVKEFCERKTIPSYPYTVETPADWKNI